MFSGQRGSRNLGQKAVALLTVSVLCIGALTHHSGCHPNPKTDEERATNRKVLTGVLIAGALLYLLGSEDESDQESQPAFFVCNYWQDDDQDGGVGAEEIKGRKSSFRANERITMAAYTHGKRGFRLTVKVWNGAGNLVHEVTNTIPFDVCYSPVEFMPWELYNKGGAGDYNVEWYLNGNLVATEEFAVLK